MCQHIEALEGVKRVDNLQTTDGQPIYPTAHPHPGGTARKLTAHGPSL